MCHHADFMPSSCWDGHAPCNGRTSKIWAARRASPYTGRPSFAQTCHVHTACDRLMLRAVLLKANTRSQPAAVAKPEVPHNDGTLPLGAFLQHQQRLQVRERPAAAESPAAVAARALIGWRVVDTCSGEDVGHVTEVRSCCYCRYCRWYCRCCAGTEGHAGCFHV